MTLTRQRYLLPMVVVALVGLSGTLMAVQEIEVEALHVHAQNGLDSNSGSSSAPFQTLNHALEKAYEFTNPPPGSVLTWVEIKVHRSATPIAPTNYGGHESSGWQTPAEKVLGVTHKAFPLRMVPFVNVIGVPRVGVLPVIEIDEQSHGPFPTDDWEPGLPKTLVWGAAMCTVRGFTIDGSHYTLNRFNHAISGVVVRNKMGFNVEDCVIRDLHDGIFYGADAGQSATGVVRHCVLSGFFPKVPSSSAPQKAGHAALWLVGIGVTDVDVIDSTFSSSHDAIEILGESDHGMSTNATLDISGTCSFHDNENGLELVGEGQATVTVSGATFIKNGNIIPDGTAFSEGSTAAVFVRGMSDTDVTIRDATFANNAYGVVSGIDATQICEIDLGNNDDPGNNTFLPFDYTEYDPGADTYRVHAFHRGESNAIFLAAGNTWIPSMQGAHAVTGCIDDGDIAGPHNLPNAGAPPGPQAGPDLMGVLWLRNFSILKASGKIEFGSICP